MKSLSLLLVVSMSVPAFAQDSLQEELSQEINVLYPKTTLKKRPSQKVAARKALDLEEESKTVIINNNITPNNSEAVREQPTSVVEASPVDQSKGAESRRTREALERGTEDVIVQRLEQDRIDAEKERAKKAQDAFNKSMDGVAPTAPAPVAVQEVQPAPVIAAPVISTPIEKTESQVEEPSVQYYVGAMGGIGDYTSASNVQGKFAGGLSFGMIFPENFILEGSFLMSRYDIEEGRCDTYNCGYYNVPAQIRMNRTNISVAAKYMFLKGRIRPVVGGVIGYTSRQFENRGNYQVNACAPYGYCPSYQGNRPSSWAMDGGLLVGADVRLAKSFTIGADLRYMMNLSYERDEDPRSRYYSGTMYNGSQPVEELSYYLFTLNATFRF